MEFLLYLTPIGRQIAQNVIKANFPIRENIEYCKNADLFGYGDFDKLVICTENIKKSGYDLHHYVNETLYHEAVHIAHMCNGYKPFNISVQDMPIPSNKLQDVKNSVNASRASVQMEHEAYWLEDKPKKVNYVVKKYCL
jgi:hypothetical protein